MASKLRPLPQVLLAGVPAARGLLRPLAFHVVRSPRDSPATQGFVESSD
jgi:hypothetical protein